MFQETILNGGWKAPAPVRTPSIGTITLSRCTVAHTHHPLHWGGRGTEETRLATSTSGSGQEGWVAAGLSSNFLGSGIVVIALLLL